MQYQVRAASEAHVRALEVNMREADRAEVWAAAHMTPGQALRHSLRASEHAITGLHGDEVLLMAGVSQMSPLGTTGWPWMLAAPGLEAHSTVFLRNSVRYVRAMREWYDRLQNYVDARNTQAIQWLLWLGFEVDDPQPFGMDRLPFHRFHWES